MEIISGECRKKTIYFNVLIVLLNIVGLWVMLTYDEAINQ